MVFRRKERESNPQGSSLGRFRSGCRRQSACPSVIRSSGRRNRTSIPCLTGRSITVIGHRIKSVRTVGFEPTISCSRSTRDTRLPHALLIGERPAGVEPALLPWQSSRLPLHHGRSKKWLPGCQRAAESTRWESNPRFRITGAVSLPLDRQCLKMCSVGSEGLEPSPIRLRAGDAAASTLIPT